MRLAASLLLLAASARLAGGQGFLEVIPEDDVNVLLNRPAVVRLVSGEELRGKMGGVGLINGYISSFTFTPDSGKRTKYTPAEVDRLTISAGKLAKMVMMNESATSIREAAGADFDAVLAREHIIYETARRANKRETPRLMQLLNPGFDSVLKVYADPNAKKSLGLSLGGVRLAGGEDKSYLFVLGEEKAVVVKKGSYKENFEELYASCPVMLELFQGEKLKWSDVAGHVFVFDRTCKWVPTPP
jgi:hypothetical protein